MSELAAVEHRLREIQAIMDSTLHHLDVDELMTALLDRVLSVLSCETAAVLLIDEESGHLVARAARGIEEEVRQGVRVPVGAGFAGRIAAQRQPIALDRVDSTTVANPLLWEKGIKVMLGVPLVAGGHLLGVLHVGRLTQRPFGLQELELLEMVGGAWRGRCKWACCATSGQRRKFCNGACSPRLSPNHRICDWPVVTFRRKAAALAATGTTRSPFPQENSGS